HGVLSFLAALLGRFGCGHRNLRDLRPLRVGTRLRSCRSPAVGHEIVCLARTAGVTSVARFIATRARQAAFPASLPALAARSVLELASSASAVPSAGG